MSRRFFGKKCQKSKCGQASQEFRKSSWIEWLECQIFKASHETNCRFWLWAYSINLPEEHRHFLFANKFLNKLNRTEFLLLWNFHSNCQVTDLRLLECSNSKCQQNIYLFKSFISRYLITFSISRFILWRSKNKTSDFYWIAFILIWFLYSCI